MSEIALRPCPFCGGPAAFGTQTYAKDWAKRQGWKQHVFHAVNCVWCGANNRGINGFHTEEEAATKWNVRACNNHDGLVNLLTEVRKWLDADLMGPWDAKFIEEIDAALSKAGNT